MAIFTLFFHPPQPLYLPFPMVYANYSENEPLSHRISLIHLLEIPHHRPSPRVTLQQLTSSEGRWCTLEAPRLQFKPVHVYHCAARLTAQPATKSRRTEPAPVNHSTAAWSEGPAKPLYCRKWKHCDTFEKHPLPLQRPGPKEKKRLLEDLHHFRENALMQRDLLRLMGVNYGGDWSE
ncbi:hypothetical protein DFH09DRAFT_1081113 [Mycena vulgaris]|nr:hypothetical protein DFH09DRAFT_1081113 [Mycena vulgaris]